MTRLRQILPAAFITLVALGMATTANAAPFTFTGVLTGDARLDAPDGLDVLVSIIGDDTSNETYWTVDLRMDATHPDAALHEFYLNLVGSSADYHFINFVPTDWTLTGTDVSAEGSGHAMFMFEHSGDNNTVTNSVNLTFTALKLTGVFTPLDFLNAGLSCSNDNLLPCSQLGAHVGSLSYGDSGFAVGDYSMPEAPSLVLMGFGLLGAGRAVARRGRVH